MSIYLNNEEKQTTINNTSNVVGTYYLAQDPKHYEVQRTNNFMFYVKFPENYFQNDDILRAVSSYAANNASEVLRVAVSSSSVPHFSVSTIQLKRGNNTMKFAGVPEFNEGKLVLDDFIGAGSKDLALAWQRKVYNVNTEKVGLASDYKLTGWLKEYTPDYQTVRTWRLDGCWISGVSENDYSHDSAEKKNVDVTLQYDKAIPYTNDLA